MMSSARLVFFASNRIMNNSFPMGVAVNVPDVWPYTPVRLEYCKEAVTVP